MKISNFPIRISIIALLLSSGLTLAEEVPTSTKHHYGDWKLSLSNYGSNYATTDSYEKKVGSQLNTVTVFLSSKNDLMGFSSHYYDKWNYTSESENIISISKGQLEFDIEKLRNAKIGNCPEADMMTYTFNDQRVDMVVQPQGADCSLKYYPASPAGNQFLIEELKRSNRIVTNIKDHDGNHVIISAKGFSKTLDQLRANTPL